jgi:NCAIR mutase (PurE)-related protein
MYAALRKVLTGVQYHARAKMLIIKPKQEDRTGPPVPKQRRLPGMLCVVSAGPEDQAAADQVKLVAEHMGCFVTTKSQMSIRDLQGLMDKLPGGATGWGRGPVAAQQLIVSCWGLGS